MAQTRVYGNDAPLFTLTLAEFFHSCVEPIGPRYISQNTACRRLIFARKASRIDMMAAVTDLETGHMVAARLEGRGYRLIDTSMRNRLFLRRAPAVDCSAFQLHIVERSTWDDRNERLLRDYLRVHSEAIAAYAAIKMQLARDYAEDSLAYTKAKTAFIQELVDTACKERELPPVDVWND